MVHLLGLLRCTDEGIRKRKRVRRNMVDLWDLLIRGNKEGHKLKVSHFRKVY